MKSLITDIRTTDYHSGFYQGERGLVGVGARDAATVRQMDRLYLRIICQNYEAFEREAGGHESEALFVVAAEVLKTAALAGYVEGDYVLTLKSGGRVRFTLSMFDQVLINQWEEVLKRLGVKQ